MQSVLVLLGHFFIIVSYSKSYLEQQGITEYELVNFNLDEFESFGIIQFDFNDQHYKVQLQVNENISPIIQHQTQSQSTIKHPKIDEIWYVFSISNKPIKHYTNYYKSK